MACKDCFGRSIGSTTVKQSWPARGASSSSTWHGLHSSTQSSTKGSESNAAAFVSSKLVSALLLSLVLLLVLQGKASSSLSSSRPDLFALTLSSLAVLIVRAPSLSLCKALCTGPCRPPTSRAVVFVASAKGCKGQWQEQFSWLPCMQEQQ